MYRDSVLSLEPVDVLPGRMPAVRALRVGMIGIGTVGSGTARVLARNREEIAGRAGRPIELVRVAARNLARAATIVGAGVPLTDDPMRIAADPEIDVLVELAGGTGAARDWVLAAIAHGKHVVTANKALLAVHGEEIFAAARARGVAVGYEAAVAGCIPIVKALREGLAGNRIEWLAGIVNGTTNFILGRMRDAGLDFGAALAEAQALGYAEADPRFDVEGIDAAHKLSLLAANAFGMPLRFDAVQVQGIAQLHPLDVACAGQLGFRIKLLALARRRAGGIELRVQPALLPASQLLAQVDGPMNGVVVRSDAAGLTTYCGAGAGSEQTASAVIADLIDVARLDGRSAARQVPHLGFQPEARRELRPLPRAELRSRHYLRVPVRTASDGIGAVAACLGEGCVPLLRIVKAALPADAGTQLLVLTSEAALGALDAAVAALQRRAEVAGPVVALRVEMLED